jgi:hypothetical protein
MVKIDPESAQRVGAASISSSAPMSRLSAARPFDVIDMEISYCAEAIEACE